MSARLLSGLALGLLAACAAPPVAPPPASAPDTTASGTPPATPRDRALGLYGPVEETPPAPVVTYDGSEPAREFYDPVNPGAAFLQRADEATAAFPRDRLGNVDWVRTLAERHIAPRSDLGGRARPERLDTVLLLTDTRDMPYVGFPHRQHTEWLACSNCHPAPFATEVGANPISMGAILAGQYCGVCHDRVAFSTFACERCHNTPNPDSPVPAW